MEHRLQEQRVEGWQLPERGRLRAATALDPREERVTEERVSTAALPVVGIIKAFTALQQPSLRLKIALEPQISMRAFAKVCQAARIFLRGIGVPAFLYNRQALILANPSWQRTWV